MPRRQPPTIQLDYDVMLEPTITNPFLELFYAEPKKYALKLQVGRRRWFPPLLRDPCGWLTGP